MGQREVENLEKCRDIVGKFYKDNNLEGIFIMFNEHGFSLAGYRGDGATLNKSAYAAMKAVNQVNDSAMAATLAAECMARFAIPYEVALKALEIAYTNKEDQKWLKAKN